VPSLNIPFSDDELEVIRGAAASENVSLRAFVHAAAVEAASEHKRRVAEAAKIVAARSAELNRRLA
jgi:uncharacterized protein (DUF1778 family)